MPLNLPDGTACFVDANIFYYHFVDKPPFSDACTDFLDRVSKGRLAACASTHVLAEAIHKIMLAEAAARFQLDRARLVNWLQRHSDQVRELEEFRQAAAELGGLKLSILTTDAPLLIAAAELSKQTGLLTNDAIIAALMRRHGLIHLVTNDDDFDHVPGLTVWKPREAAPST